MVDSHGLVNGCMEIRRSAGVAGGQRCILVATSINLPTTNTSTSKRNRVDGRVVVSPSLAIDLGSAPKFGKKYHEGLVELSSLVEVGEKGRSCLIEHG